METAKKTSFSSTVKDQPWVCVADYAASRFSYRDRASWFAQVQAGNFEVNGQTATVSTRLIPGDRVTWCTLIIEPEVNRDIGIIWEDDDILAINKPAPLPCHAKAPYFRNTLVSILREKRSEPGLRLAHRLDMGTTGVMLLARNANAMSEISRQFESRTVKKTYLAQCAGRANWSTQTVDLALSKAEHSDRPRSQVDPAGKPASTQFRLIRQYDDSCLVEASPLTGRMHQIRVHLASLGLPVMGDSTYGGSPAGEMRLHASSISFRHPGSGNRMTLAAPVFWQDL